MHRLRRKRIVLATRGGGSVGAYDHFSAGDDWLKAAVATIDIIANKKTKPALLVGSLIFSYWSLGRESTRGLDDQKPKPGRRASCHLYLS